MNFGEKNPQHDYPKMRGEGGVQRPFGTFPKIHPFLKGQASLTVISASEEALTKLGEAKAVAVSGYISFQLNSLLHLFVCIFVQDIFLKTGKMAFSCLQNPDALIIQDALFHNALSQNVKKVLTSKLLDLYYHNLASSRHQCKILSRSGGH